MKTYNYEGRIIPQTKLFPKFINKVPIEQIIKLPTYRSLLSLKKAPQFITVTVNDELSKTFTHDGKGGYFNGKQSKIDFLLLIQKLGKVKVTITRG